MLTYKTILSFWYNVKATMCIKFIEKII